MPTHDPEPTGALEELHAEILACRKCEIAGPLWEAHPIAGGRTSATVLVIGQAPGHRSMVRRAHFMGPGGKLLRTWLARGGIPLERQDEVVYLSSLTRCFPGPAPRNAAGDRKPSRAEIELCTPYLERELALLDPPLVVLVGSMAIQRFLGRVPLRDRVGTLVWRDDRHWLPLPHPSGVSRWLNDPTHQRLVDEGLALMRAMLEVAANEPGSEAEHSTSRPR